ncbi:MAG: hypothetical protein CMB77_04560 [Euryarchaeota archaeon]|nr:hypothetical protein [Euryarchaeota archaeon]|tara:strand:+ start:3003 stop:3248 length:246 start_codon:yes stop_codon:yes gene_type:complete
MKDIGASEVLILASSIMAFSNLNLAIATLSLGVLGSFFRYCVKYSEKQATAREIEGAAENFTNILTGLAAGMGTKDKSNLH